jgi:hypothetical protein
MRVLMKKIYILGIVPFLILGQILFTMDDKIAPHVTPVKEITPIPPLNYVTPLIPIPEQKIPPTDVIKSFHIVYHQPFFRRPLFSITGSLTDINHDNPRQINITDNEKNEQKLYVTRDVLSAIKWILAKNTTTFIELKEDIVIDLKKSQGLLEKIKITYPDGKLQEALRCTIGSVRPSGTSGKLYLIISSPVINDQQYRLVLTEKELASLEKGLNTATDVEIQGFLVSVSKKNNMTDYLNALINNNFDFDKSRYDEQHQIRPPIPWWQGTLFKKLIVLAAGIAMAAAMVAFLSEKDYLVLSRY